MLTDDKTITTPSYWDRIYSGKNDNAKVDASNTKRPANVFDRFAIVLPHVIGPKVLDVGSGHARICQRLKQQHPEWDITASDQAEAAMNVTPYRPYIICSAYNLPFDDKTINTVIASQMIEYLEDIDKFLLEAKRIANCFVCTVPIGIMKSWSQLYNFDKISFIELLSKYGEVLVQEDYGEILLCQTKFM
jgi:ubiquinone/menaquinone biosynthesis C-methylase UbiE